MEKLNNYIKELNKIYKKYDDSFNNNLNKQKFKYQHELYIKFKTRFHEMTDYIKNNKKMLSENVVLSSLANQEIYKLNEIYNKGFFYTIHVEHEILESDLNGS